MDDNTNDNEEGKTSLPNNQIEYIFVLIIMNY